MNAASWELKSASYQQWFFKLNATPLALLVGWVLRPDARPRVRISLQSVAEPRVRWYETSVQSYQTGIATPNTILLPTFTRGEYEDLAWEFEVAAVRPPLVPEAHVPSFSRVFPLSTHIVSIPAARFRGWIRYQERTWEGEAWGSLAHYWGRSLPSHWFWLNAVLNGGDAFVEVLVARQRIGPLFWPRVQVGYFWIRQQERERLWIHPLTGRVYVHGLPDQPVVRSMPWHGTGYRMKGRTHPKAWQKLDKDVINSLTGEVHVPGVGDAYGCAAIEWRRPPTY